MTTDAERLRVLLGERNKAQFAREHGIPGGASMISQHLSGHRPISLEAAIAYARGLGVPIEEISPAAARQLQDGLAVAKPREHYGTRLEENKLPRPANFATEQVDQPARMDLGTALGLVVEALAAVPKVREPAVAALLQKAVAAGHVDADLVLELLRWLTPPAALPGKRQAAA